MCGIAGTCGIVDVSCDHILQRISHRGPDGLKRWNTNEFSLGHGRLSIIDLSHKADQPMTDPATGNVIAYNGEIYNYLELKKELSDYNFLTASDTEVILAAYNKWGVACLNKLRGMFAIALFDKRKNALLIARDRMGIKPFYYRKTTGGFAFCSEIKGLVDRGIKQDSMNEFKAAEFLCARQLDCNEETMFSDIFQLQPASYAWVDQKGMMSSPVQYWEFPKHGNKIYKEEQHGPELVSLFQECINIHLRSDVPIGAFVSGGLDSSSVAAFVLNDNSIDKLHTFSAILPVRNEENKLIDLMLGHEKVHKHEFYLDGQHFYDEVGDVIYHNDEPIQDGSMYSHYKLCEIASSAGVKVLLSGAGGDELFGGYNSHIYAYLGSILKRAQLIKYIRKVKAIAANTSYPASDLIKKSFQETLPFRLRRKYKHHYFSSLSAHTHLEKFADQLPYFYYTDNDPWTANYLNNYKSWSVPPYLHYEDRNSMAFGVEIRVPFFDHKLIEYISGFHPDSLINGRSKSMLRQSFKGIVPEKILSQKAKFGFPSPIDVLLRNKEKTSPVFNQAVSDIPFYDGDKTRKLATDFFNNQADIGLFWRTMSLAIWYKKFFSN